MDLINYWTNGTKIKYNYIEIVDKRHITIAGSNTIHPFNKLYDFKTASEARDFFNKFVEQCSKAGYTVKHVDSNTVVFKCED